MTTVSLSEWETLTPKSDSVLAKLSFAAYPTARRLAEELTRVRRIEVLELAQGLEIRAKSFVGRIPLGPITLTVLPKIASGPLLGLLRYAYGLRQLTMHDSTTFDLSAFSFQDLLIHQLASEVEELVGRGIHRDYECIHDNLLSPRGRIDFARYARTAHHARTTIPCVYHPRSEDTLLNRVVLAGLRLASTLAIDAELTAHVRWLAKILGENVTASLLNPQILAKAWSIVDRRTFAYKPALTLIDVLLSGEGLALHTQRTRVRLPGFLFDMNRFFQALLSRFRHDNLEGVEVKDEYRLREMFEYENGENPLARPAPRLRPDFVVLRNGKMLAILDAKYKDLWAQSLPREMLYQVSLYAIARRDGERRAVILYPTVEHSAREQTVMIREPIHGTVEARVTLRPVNLLHIAELLRLGLRTQLQRKRLAAELAFGNLAH